MLHVVPRDLARGSQVYARALADRLDGRCAEHEVLSLFESEPLALRPEHRLDIRPGRLRTAGYDPRVPVRLFRRLRRLRPDVVVTHGGEALLYVVPVLPRRTVLVHKRIGIASEARLNAAKRWLHRAAMRRAAAVAAVSAETLEETRRVFGLPEDRLHLLPNGRDPDAYRPRAQWAGSEPALLYVGELEAVKRPERFIALVAALRVQGVALRASMAGSGPLVEPLGPDASAAGVELLGRRADVPELLATSDVLCLTSRTEGMPGVLIEAGLAGIPAVTTDVSGARAVVEDGVTGFVVPVEDFDALCARTRQLLESPELRRRMGRAARERCVEHFSIDVSADRWADLLARVARSPGQAGASARAR